MRIGHGEGEAGAEGEDLGVQPCGARLGIRKDGKGAVVGKALRGGGHGEGEEGLEGGRFNQPAPRPSQHSASSRGLCASIFGADVRALYSCRSPQTALKCSFSGDRVTRD